MISSLKNVDEIYVTITVRFHTLGMDCFQSEVMQIWDISMAPTCYEAHNGLERKARVDQATRVSQCNRKGFRRTGMTYDACLWFRSMH